MDEWWINEVGQNLLTTDDSGRDRLPDDYILDFLTKHASARESYLRLFNTLSIGEQDRLQPLYTRALVKARDVDEKQFHDRIQSKWNRAGVYTAGPRGGTRVGGN
jgi:hypothetical protein